MYVIDLFKELKPEDIIARLIEFPDFFQDIDWNNTISEEEKTLRKNTIKELYMLELMKIKEKNIKYNDSGMIIVTKRLDDEGYYDPSFIDLTEKQKYIDCVNNTDLDNFKNPLYSVSLMDRNELLSYKLSDINLNTRGKVLVAASILNDITFFGIEEAPTKEKQDEIIDSLISSIDDIEKNSGNYKSLDEVFKDLNIEREEKSEEEKALEHEKYVNQMKKEIKELIDELSEIVKKEL